MQCYICAREARLVSTTAISREGAPAPLTRIFGWAMLACLLAFLINNFLTVGYDYPGVRAVLSDGGAQAYIQLLVYGILIALAVFFVLKTPSRALRWDAQKISNFNAYLVRGFFFAVFFCGIADAAISFMRVENLLGNFFSDDIVRGMGRAQYVGTYVHYPLIVLGFIIAIFSRTLGFTWLALLIVAAELAIVLTRFIFSYEQALMGDLVRYWYAALFLFASAYTLIEDGHVRVDVFYAGFGASKKGFVNAVGTILLGMTTAWVIIAIGFGGKQSIINSPVANFEVSQTGGTGMFIKYQMAAFIGIFAITMLIQFVSYLFDAVADRRGEPGRRETVAAAH